MTRPQTIVMWICVLPLVFIYLSFSLNNEAGLKWIFDIVYRSENELLRGILTLCGSACGFHLVVTIRIILLGSSTYWFSINPLEVEIAFPEEILHALVMPKYEFMLNSNEIYNLMTTGQINCLGTLSSLSNDSLDGQVRVDVTLDFLCRLLAFDWVTMNCDKDDNVPGWWLISDIQVDSNKLTSMIVCLYIVVPVLP